MFPFGFPPQFLLLFKDQSKKTWEKCNSTESSNFSRTGLNTYNKRISFYSSLNLIIITHEIGFKTHISVIIEVIKIFWNLDQLSSLVNFAFPIILCVWKDILSCVLFRELNTFNQFFLFILLFFHFNI